MPGKPDVLCAGGCGKLLWRSVKSVGGYTDCTPTCNKCRVETRERDCPPCSTCGGAMSVAWKYRWMSGAKTDSPTCKSCRDTERAQVMKDGKQCRECQTVKPLTSFGGLNGGAVCWTCRAPRTDRTKTRIAARRRRAARETTWDLVSDEEILDRDLWSCKMAVCLHPDGREITKMAWPDRWSASIDHVIPLSQGGSDQAINKRAAHLRCNVSRGNRAETVPDFGNSPYT